jgi:hypothetical protein
MSGSLPWPVTPNVLRRPRYRLLVNQAPINGTVSMSVSTNNTYEPSTLSAVIALGEDPGLLATLTGTDAAVLLEAQACFLAPGAAEGSGSWTSMFAGELDKPTVNLLQRSVTIEARDLGRRLVDTKTNGMYPNMTVSQVAKTFATQCGLQADVDSFPQMAGPFFQADHDKTTHDSYNKTQS